MGAALDSLIKVMTRKLRSRAAAARYRAAHPDYLEKARIRSRARYKADPEARRAERWQWVISNPAKYLWSAAKVRARSAGLEFTISFSDVIIPENCPYLGVKLVLGGSADSSPSLDRIDNERGYVPGNVEVISQRTNRAKNNLTLAELKMFAAAIAERVA